MACKEIGGMFDLDPSRDCHGSGTHTTSLTDCLLTLTGRTALDLILRDIEREFNVDAARRPIAHLPSYCCDSMIEPFVRHGYRVTFYPIEIDAEGILAAQVDPMEPFDVFLSTSYFGFAHTSMQSTMKHLAQKGVIVIEDVTHRLFCGPFANSFIAHYEFASIRKWLGLPSGGYARKRLGSLNFQMRDSGEVVKIAQKSMELKHRYLGSTKASHIKEQFLAGQRAFERTILNDYESRGIDDLSANLISTANVDFIREARVSNAQTLMNELASIENLVLPTRLNPELDAPLFVPIMVDARIRSGVVNKLKTKELYMPVHWPRSRHVNVEYSDQLYNEEISLVCDHRYSEVDMKRLARELKELLQ